MPRICSILASSSAILIGEIVPLVGDVAESEEQLANLVECESDFLRAAQNRELVNRGQVVSSLSARSFCGSQYF